MMKYHILATASALLFLSACDYMTSPSVDNPLDTPVFNHAVGLAPPSPCRAPQTEIIGQWTGDEDASDNQGGADGKLVAGARAGVRGLVNGAFAFDGRGFIQLPNTINLTHGTLGMWISTSRTSQGIVDGGLGFPTWRLAIDENGVAVYRHWRVHTGGYTTLTGTTVVADGSFHHLAIQADTPNKTISLYVDGELETAYTEDDPNFAFWALAGLGQQKIGKTDTEGLPGPLFFTGLIDEFEQYYRVLDPDEINTIYKAGAECLPPMITPTTPQLLADLIDGLVESGKLDRKDAKKLTKKLDKFNKELGKGKTDKAIKELGKFIKEVDKLVDKGELSREDGEVLADAAQAIINGLQGTDDNPLGLLRDLISQAGLDKKDAKKLSKSLDKVLNEMDKGKTDKAVKKLREFIEKVEDLVSDRELSSGQGAAMINAANRLIDDVNA